MPEIWQGLENMQELAGGTSKPIFPMMFISIACGAVSGFHATQSPLMARCFSSEKQGRPIFYGSMITEGVVGLIWAAAATYIFHNPDLMAQIGLTYADVESKGGPLVVNGLSGAWLGTFGAVLAVIGVVACPITSGDTAMRAARLMVAEIFGFEQKKLSSRLYLALPLFGISLLLLTVFSNQFGVLWRYFAFINQLLAMCTLWVITVFLFKHRKGWFYVMALLPALFMTMVIFTYFFRAPECLGGVFANNELYQNTLSYLAGAAATVSIFCIFIHWANKTQRLPDAD
ncbi:MAG: hypothetical protein K2I87_02415 [Bacteroidales bacterium]|nr:hypothetical protein [Bacteroidales bacterium]